MAVAINVQSDAGDVANANAYVSIAAFKAYCDQRGYDYTTAAYTDDQIAQAIIRATDYLDQRFQFIGVKLLSTQTTMWPRQAPQFDGNGTLDSDIFTFGSPTIYLFDADGNQIVGIPQAVKNANVEYAFRALAANLFQDAPAPDGGRLIDSETISVDSVSRSVTYAPAQATGTFQLPAFPLADLMLSRAGLVLTGRRVYR